MIFILRMQLNTPVPLPKEGFTIEHRSKILLMGSCFTQNIGTKLTAYKFDACVNPFGTAYNPLSIATILQRIVNGKAFDEESPEIFESGELWHSILHHSDFSQNSREKLIKTINLSMAQAREHIKSCDIYALTLGTAYVYVRNSDNLVVNNCHKLPAKMFTRRLLGIEEITESMSHTMRDIIAMRPKARFIFTVSPIRHLRDGAHDNQLSKSTLLLAINKLQALFPDNCTYFPAYEIMLDELRDYRFYAEDMVHPSPLAIEYIWQKFMACYLGEKSTTLCDAIDNINKKLAHRPFNPQSNAYKTFVQGVVQEITELITEHPYLDFKNEFERCNTLLNR